MLGVTFDNEENDYPYTQYGFVMIIAIVRTALGDLQPPLYENWSDGDASSGFHITLIWLNYLLCLGTLVLLSLNLVVAIVLKSYDRVIKNQDKALCESIMELNWNALNEKDPKPNEDIDFILMI